MLRDMDVEISAELEEEEEIYRDGIRKCIAALRYHHKRAETCSNGYTGSTLEEDTLKSINFLKRNNIAAMLQGAKPVSQTYNLPELIEGMEVSIDVSTCDADLGNRYFGTVTEALELDTAKNGYILLVQDAEPNFDINGNSPVTPDGWISCSERMPEETGDIIVVSDGIVMSGISYSRRDGFYIAALKYDDDEPIGGVTHWMPLPEPPQGVNDELA
ncbi:prophage protein [Escherichia coli]|nr:prophage protein [Escherichia coli]